jgi:hypothetical protein
LNIEKNKVIPFEIKTVFRSYTHILNKQAFAILQKDQTNLKVIDVQSDRLVIKYKNTFSEFRTLNQFLNLANYNISNFLISLNVATLGIFSWDWKTVFSPIYDGIDPQMKGIKKLYFSQHNYSQFNKFKDKRTVDELDIRNTVLLFGALNQDIKSIVRSEYIKGIIHLGLSYFDINFNKEAFGNFYRSFENFATDKLLKLGKLKNELKQLKDALSFLGLENDVVDELDHLYLLRSEHIMHAQKKQDEINLDDILKLKYLLDFVIIKVYKPIWEKGIEG